jgi:hypothetical protein
MGGRTGLGIATGEIVRCFCFRSRSVMDGRSRRMGPTAWLEGRRATSSAIDVTTGALATGAVATGAVATYCVATGSVAVGAVATGGVVGGRAVETGGAALGPPASGRAAGCGAGDDGCDDGCDDRDGAVAEGWGCAIAGLGPGTDAFGCVHLAADVGVGIRTVGFVDAAGVVVGVGATGVGAPRAGGPWAGGTPSGPSPEAGGVPAAIGPVTSGPVDEGV